MSEEANKALVRRWFEEGLAEATRDPSRLDELLSDHHHDHFTNHTPHHHDADEHGLDGLKGEIRNIGAAFGPLEVFVDHMVAEGDLVCVHWIAPEAAHWGRGRLRHVGEVDGSGAVARLSGLSLYRVTDGKIAESWQYTDATDVLVQLGALTIVPA